MKIDIRLGSKKKKKINQDYNNFIVQNMSRNMFKKYNKSKKDRYKNVSYFISFTKCNKF